MKGVIEIGAGIIILLVIAGALMFVPGLGNSALSIITGPQTCNIAPYAWNCYCPIGFEKSPASIGEWDSSIKYICIPEMVVTDCEYPISYAGSLTDEFKTNVFSCAKEYIITNYPDCVSKDCSDPMWKEIGTVVDVEKTYGYVQCRDPQAIGGVIRWQVTFDILNGSLHPSLWLPFCN